MKGDEETNRCFLIIFRRKLKILSLSVALKPFRLLPLFQFLNPIHSRYYSLDGESARRKVVTCIQNNTNTEKTHTDIHVSSGIRTHDPNVRASEEEFMP
jgi:hypothetical protein